MAVADDGGRGGFRTLLLGVGVISSSMRIAPATGDADNRRSLTRRAVAFAAVTAAFSAAMCAPLAHADVSATVKVQTQRMSDANLGSQQDGSYNAGDQVSLVCSKRGQPVKGYFSFNIPGGFDDLWYKTSDGHFVADVDIETGTLDVVTPECGGAPQPQPPVSESRADAAVDKANSMVGTDTFGDVGCGKFVAAAYGVPGIGYNTAKQFRDALASQGKIHMEGDPPKGALVFSQSSWDQGAGHVVIARGDGTFVSGGVYKGYNGIAGGGHNVQVLPNWNPAQGAAYLGWAVAPW